MWLGYEGTALTKRNLNQRMHRKPPTWAVKTVRKSSTDGKRRSELFIRTERFQSARPRPERTPLPEPHAHRGWLNNVSFPERMLTRHCQPGKSTSANRPSPNSVPQHMPPTTIRRPSDFILAFSLKLFPSICATNVISLTHNL